MTSTATNVYTSAQRACDSLVDLADNLDALGRYNLPQDIDIAALTAQHISNILKVAYQIAFAYHNAIPAPRDALKIYDVDERSYLRVIRKHSLFAFRSGYDAFRCFDDIHDVARRLEATTNAKTAERLRPKGE
ncbi:hypothetical protein [Rhodococcus sp. 1139]|uniref:hypothetical protein n=1 Tax=Rhodococcus sp. 1139 TaxID=1833762 RepID=UPI000871C498|nr:hypothetical protein [Rhodococcus sp. 1139]OFE08649.1 hypothetical protein A5N83_11290 [Rhodococcus sp. 1139]